jgi:hypothetical protein
MWNGTGTQGSGTQKNSAPPSDKSSKPTVNPSGS